MGMLRTVLRTHPTKLKQFLTTVRSIHQDVACNAETPDEIDIPVPWGKIKGLWWGPKDRQPILGLHGWLDNAETFSTLVPLLPKNTSLLAIDFPGQGFSDWLPAGMPYKLVDSLLIIRRINKYFGWKEIKLMGHSLGGIMVFNYTTHFPETTKLAITLDIVRSRATKLDQRVNSIATAVEQAIDFESRLAEAPGHGYKELVQKWLQGVNNSFDETACKILMKRGTKRKPDGSYYFSFDPMVKKYRKYHIGYSQEMLLYLASRIKCPYYVLKADNSPYYDEKELVLRTIDAMREANPLFHFSPIQGTHYVHLTHPERVAKLINPFLEKYDT